MKILVVSGSLGAGKTTFIQMLAKRLNKDFVVYENEFGEADLDARSLRQDSALEVWESTENCICCSGKQDFASSILTIYNTLHPEYLVVEPTGVARLSSVMENIRQITYGDMEVLAPITIVDNLSWRAHKAHLGSIFEDQIKSAKTIIISKREADTPEDLLDYLKSNSTADVVCERYEAFDLDFLTSIISTEAELQQAQSNTTGEDPAFETLSLKHVELTNPVQLISFLDDMVRGLFGDIVRAKGVIPVAREALRFDVVDGVWAITSTQDAEDPVCVVIGNHIARNAIRKRIVPVIWHDEAEIKHEHHHDHDHDHDHDHEHHDHGHLETKH